MLVTDHSRSMLATDVEPDRLSRGAARGAARSSTSCPTRVRVGVVAFSDAPDAVQAPSTDHDDARAHRRRGRSPTAPPPPATRSQVALDTLRARQAGRQAPAGGDRAAVRRQDHDRARSGRRRAHARRAAKIPIYTVALGTRDATVPNPDRSAAAARPARPGDAAPDRRRPPAARPSRPRTPTRCPRSTRRSARSSAPRSQARGDGRVRDRRSRAAARRRRRLAALGRAAAVAAPPDRGAQAGARAVEQGGRCICPPCPRFPRCPCRVASRCAGSWPRCSSSSRCCSWR